MVTIRIPALPRGMGTNLLGLVGLVAIVLAIGGLTGNWWWSVLAAGGFAVAGAVMAQNSAGGEPAQPEQTEALRPVSRLGVA